MKGAKHCWVFLFPCLWLFSITFDALAQDHIVVLEQDIKAVSAVSSGRYIKIAWKVKLQNKTNKPIACDVAVLFLNSGQENIGKASKTSTLEPNEIKIVSDTVLLEASVANQIATCAVSVEEK
jgi:hypothetical protein